jgi:alpha-L-fucosidase
MIETSDSSGRSTGVTTLSPVTARNLLLALSVCLSLAGCDATAPASSNEGQTSATPTALELTGVAGNPAPLAPSLPGAETPPQAGPGTNYAFDDPFTAARTQWWRDDRFGLFIHFGVFSQLEGQYTRPDGSLCLNAEWIQRECEIPQAAYERIAASFDPAGFDAEAIAQLAVDAGQKYVVITAKHHEGYAMWPTKVNEWNLRDHSAFDKFRDIMAELKAATAARGIELGFYYSIWDWHDPDFPDVATFPRYRQRMYTQLKELVDTYHPAMLWFDGQWSIDRPNNPWTEQDGEQLEAYVRALSPGIIVNNRIGKQRVVDGDTGTAEQDIPAMPVVGQLWENCMTLNGSWGFAKWDSAWKSSSELIRNLVNIAARSGNYLLNVGPDAHGRIPAESVERLSQIGAWLRSNGRAVYRAQAPGIVVEPGWGAVSRSGNKLYASVYQWPAAGDSLQLDALAPFEVTGARVLDSLQYVAVSRNANTLTITPSGAPTSETASVIELTVRSAAPAGAASGHGLAAQFWPNADFSGDPVVSRTDATVNYNWKFSGSPDVALSSDTFAARWTGQVEAPYSDTYTFTAVSDDTVRLWVAGQLIIDGLTPHGPAVDSASIALQAGQRYAIAAEHSKRSGEASMKLIWSSPHLPQQVIPTARLY